MPHFTAQIPNLRNVGPVVEVQFTPPPILQEIQKSAGETISSGVRVLALIDTGATRTVLKRGLAKKLGLNPVGSVRINTPSSTGVLCYEYVVQVTFPANVNVNCVVIESDLKDQPIQCLIGRDILALGTLIYMGHSELFSLSF